MNTWRISRYSLVALCLAGLLRSLPVCPIGPQTVWAQTGIRSILVVSLPTSPFRDVAAAIRSDVPDKGPWTVEVLYLEGERSRYVARLNTLLRNNPDLVIAIGKDAYDLVHDQYDPTHTIGMLIALPRGQAMHFISAVADPVMIFRLLQGMWRKDLRIGIILSTAAEREAEVLRDAASYTQSQIEVVVAAPEEILDRLKTLVDTIDVLLLFPDPGVYQAVSPDFMIRYCLDHQVAPIALFGAGTQMGAAVTITPRYADIPDILVQIIRHPGTFAPVFYLEVDRVVVNRKALALTRLPSPRKKVENIQIQFQ